MNKTKIILIVAMGALIAAFFAFDLGQYLTLEALKANRDALQTSYQANRAVYILGFIGLYIAATALSLPGATILTLGGGAVFGNVTGTASVAVGATLGATAAFLVARYLFRGPIEQKFGDKLKGFNDGVEKGGLGYLLFLRLVPLFPFFLINLGAGLTSMSLRTYVLGTMFGILPGTFVFCNAGAQIANIDSVGEIASPQVLGAFALLGLFALIPTLYQKFKRKAT